MAGRKTFAGRETFEADRQGAGELESLQRAGTVELVDRAVEEGFDDVPFLTAVNPEDQAGVVPCQGVMTAQTGPVA